MCRLATARILATLLVAFPVGAHADEPIPDSATIRDRIAAATGRLPAAYRETFETTSSNGAVTIERYTRREADYRDVVDDGPFHQEHGVAKGQAWHQNDNGQTVLDQPGPGTQSVEHLTTTVSRVRAPIDGFVIAVLNAQGYGTKDYVDASTWRVTRSEVLTANGNVVTTYDDFRLDNGRTFAHRWHVDNRIANITQDVRVTAYETGDVRDSDVAMANPRRALVHFPAGRDTVVLPATFNGARVTVRVAIGERGLDFVLDTGASGISIDASVADELELTPHAQHEAVTADRFSTARTIIPEMRVGDLVMRDVAVEELPQGWKSAPGVKEVGLLGFDFLAELGVTIDYEHQRVTVVPGDRYTPPTDRHTTALDVRLRTGQPMVTASMNGAIGDRWILDTGGFGTFLIFDHFARLHPDAIRGDTDGTMRTGSFAGIGGTFTARPYRIAELRLGNIRFKDFTGYRVVSKQSYASDHDGLVGPTFLRLFTVGLDYGNSRVYLVPTAATRAAVGIRD